MSKKQKHHFIHIGLPDRRKIESCLNKGNSARSIASALGLSPSSVTAEVARNRCYATRAHKGEEVGPECPDTSICLRLQAWPYVCNGCNHLSGCKRPYKMKYVATDAQRLADRRLQMSRQGIHLCEQDAQTLFDYILDGLARGLSPYVIATSPECPVPISPSSIYYWASHPGFPIKVLDLLCAVGYRRRRSKKAQDKKADKAPVTSSNNFEAFLALSAETRARAYQDDTVEGKQTDTTCIYTRHLVRFHFQFFFVAKKGLAGPIVRMQDALESLLGFESYKKIFGIGLCDRGSEFHNWEGMQKSCIDRRKIRSHVYYCDAQASHQKGACERNHRELRAIFPKATKTMSARSLEGLTPQHCALMMSHINSKPRPALGGKSPIELFHYMYPKESQIIFDAFGIEKIPVSQIVLRPELIDLPR